MSRHWFWPDVLGWIAVTVAIALLTMIPALFAAMMLANDPGDPFSGVMPEPPTWYRNEDVAFAAWPILWVMLTVFCLWALRRGTRRWRTLP